MCCSFVLFCSSRGKYIFIVFYPVCCKCQKKCYNSDMELYYTKRFGFTLAEVLISIVIIGVVAAIIIPTLVTKITNKGYVEKLKKNYAIIQDATNMIVAEKGDPSQWEWSVYNSGDYAANESIVESYKKYLNVVDTCPATVDTRFTKNVFCLDLNILI